MYSLICEAMFSYVLVFIVLIQKHFEEHNYSVYM